MPQARAISNLFGFAYARTTVGLPAFAWEVYAAFDEGEHFHMGKAEEKLQGEVRTKTLLQRIAPLSGA